MHPVALVFTYGTITALATGLGALPFVFVRDLSPRVVGWSNATAAGLMLGASFGLILEGTSYGSLQTLIGAGVGVVFIFFSHGALHHVDVNFGEIRGSDARKIFLIVAVMTVHSFSEGVAVGVAFGGGQKLAALITIAIAVHNIPEGLAISAVMRPKGAGVAACALWSVVSSVPQPLMAVPAFMFVDAFRPFLPYGLGFAAGAMVFMVFLELLPDSYKDASRPSVGLLVSMTLGAMILFQRYL
ncbi:ZIP family metal transporter [Nitrospinota bacterium]